MIHPPPNGLGKVAEAGAIIWTPVSNMGNPEEAPDPQPQLSPVLAIAGIWGMNQQLENLCLSLSVILSNK